MNNWRMVKTIFVAILIILTILVCGIYYCCHFPSNFGSYISKTPLKVFLHYQWDISKDKNKSIEATLRFEDNQITLILSGNGKMIDFDSYENQIAWHELQSMATGWYLQPDAVKIDNGVAYIGKYSFSDLSSLKTVYIPSSLEKIGKYAFLNCTGLSKVVYDGTVEEWNMVDCEDGWKDGSSIYKIECTNGIVQFN